MEYVHLGATGMKVSRLCLGGMSFGGVDSGIFSWSLKYEDAKPVIDRAIDLGINYFDTADVYSSGRSEEVIGRALEDRRKDVVVATKVHHQTGPGPNDKGLSRLHIRQSIRKSLERLRTDYVDLYQIHRWDSGTPIDETLKTLDDLVNSDGSVNYIGASSMWAWQFAKAIYASERLGLERFVSMQSHYNLCYREEETEMIPLCEEEKVAILPYSPLARGFLSGKYKRGKQGEGNRYERDWALKARYFTDEDFAIVELAGDVAKEKGATTAQIALAWLLHKDAVVSPIIGVTKVEQLDELVQAIDIKLTESEIKRLEEPYHRRPVSGFG